MTRPRPATTKPTSTMKTPVQAAGVLPWFAVIGGLSWRGGRGSRGADDGRLHPRCTRSPAGSDGRVVAVVEGLPQRCAAGLLLSGLRARGLPRGCMVTGSVVPAAHLGPGPSPRERHAERDRAHQAPD